ncbi:hypothetical protein L2E82_09133 [Cichorium intybus]|uniref:Uncharacterized protein n=1 Tax=Cichorium intybus TaxID=13427 RepID=A0ACB9G8L1_CICIN|nr:hypothetical protein L2E82_09133 [Cichorium intybus]
MTISSSTASPSISWSFGGLHISKTSYKMPCSCSVLCELECKKNTHQFGFIDELEDLEFKRSRASQSLASCRESTTFFFDAPVGIDESNEHLYSVTWNAENRNSLLGTPVLPRPIYYNFQHRRN